MSTFNNSLAQLTQSNIFSPHFYLEHIAVMISVANDLEQEFSTCRSLRLRVSQATRLPDLLAYLPNNEQLYGCIGNEQL